MAETLDQEALTLQLRRKEGTWVEWGKACHQLQKAGHNPQDIFEATGFEPIQQNQLIVAAQVFSSLEQGGAPTTVREFYQQRGSDQLYELRVLPQAERCQAAELLWRKQLGVEMAREVARAIKDFSRTTAPVPEFSSAAGDMVAYHYWCLAQRQSDLAERSRMIARALSLVATEPARQRIEALLADPTPAPVTPAPFWPVYRPDPEEGYPQLLPLVGCLPLTESDLEAVPTLERHGPFQFVTSVGKSAWVAVPGWPVLMAAKEPVAVLAPPQTLAAEPEGALLVIDREDRTWDPAGYFLTIVEEDLQLDWFADQPSGPLLGRLVLVLRPPRGLDLAAREDLWQIEE